ncbi:MAG: crossover junction endodeoxyribonuclease RuvC [Sedimentisphaerales bacterium]|nr:crossover junction endodeoxyribonuclease RuvC [Sedimentisphaerales bacterium]
MRILGIDPGLGTCGYAVIETKTGTEQLIEAGTFRTDDKLALENRLDQIAQDFADILEKLKPDIVAVEKLYSHYAHPNTAILMGHARGVILQKCAENNIEVKNFSATKIKKSITGNGRASKEQIQKAIKVLMKLPDLPQPPDVADALAAALCCANSMVSL